MKMANIQSGYGCKFCVRKSGKHVNLIEFLSKQFSDDFWKVFWKTNFLKVFSAFLKFGPIWAVLRILVVFEICTDS